MPTMVIMFWLLMLAINLVCFWRIFEKAGFKGAYALIMVVPVLNIAGLLLLAFVEWPVHRLVNYLDEQRGR